MSDKSQNSHIERTVYVAPTVKPGDELRYGDWADTAASVHWFTEHPHPTIPNYTSSRSHFGDGIPLTIIEVATGSDYSGSLVEISNARTLKAEFPWLVEIYGGHGTHGLAYLGKREHQNDRLIEAIDSLAEYPVYSDDDHSSLEWESAAAAWEDGGRDDFKRALVKYFDEQYAPDEHDLDETPNERIDTLWRALTERLNGGEEHLNEQGDQIYFPVYQIFEKIMRCWPGMSRPGYDGSPSLDTMLVRLAEDCTIATSIDTEQANDA